MVTIGEKVDSTTQAVYAGDAYIGELVHVERGGWSALRDRDRRYRWFKLRREAIEWLTSE